MAENEEDMWKLLTSECIEVFKDIGFTKKKEGIFYCKYSSELYLSLGLNVSKKTKDCICINPMFGVGWETLENLLSRLSGKKYSPFLYASFSSNIGGFKSDNVARGFDFYRDKIADDVASFSSFLSDVSNSTIIKYPDHKSIIKGLERYPPIQQRVERMICAYFLLGEQDKSLELLRNELKNLETEHPVMQDYFKRFADAFTSQIFH